MQKEELSEIKKCVEAVQKVCISHYGVKNKTDKNTQSFYNQIARKSMQLLIEIEKECKNQFLQTDKGITIQQNAELEDKEAFSDLSYVQIDMQEQGFDILFYSKINSEKQRENSELQEIKRFLQNLWEKINSNIPTEQQKEEIEHICKTYPQKSKATNIICNLFSHI